MQTGLDETEGDLVLVGDEQHGMRADDLRRLWHSYAQQQGRQEPKPEANVKPAVSRGQSRWFERMLAWKPAQKPAVEPQLPTGTPEGNPDEAVAVALGIQRRVDTREKTASHKSIVHPLYLAQRQQALEQSSGRMPPGYGPIDRGSAPRGPADRRQKS